VRWVSDRTERFLQRPYYEPEEIDHLCEEIVTGFLQDRHGSVSYPIATNDLTVLIEREAQDVDLYADLSSEGHDVEGLTDFIPGERPKVRIARELSEQPWRENRLRTTLTHELGHVTMHSPFYAGSHRQRSLFDEPGNGGPSSPRCKRDAILLAGSTDWMEWQAGYASGAFLMPRAAVYATVMELLMHVNFPCPLSVGTAEGQELLGRVQKQFSVSADAARVRLMQLHYLTRAHPAASLF